LEPFPLPAWLTILAALLFGLVIGSFLNVVIYRLPRGLSLVKPASRCPGCEKPIRAYQNIPLLSYLWLRGKCSNCRQKISIRYPVVELTTALLFIAVTVRFGLSPVTIFRDWVFVSILVAVTFIDLEHRIIPDYLSLGGLAWGLLTCYWSPTGWVSCLSGAALGFGAFYALAWIYQSIAGRSGLGGGDIKLLAMLGAFLGPGGVFASILISSVFGSLVGLSWALAAKIRGKKDGIMTFAIPYGPFLVVGGLYFYLLSDYLWFQFMTPT
jgi:leader peptidase (prepilin peptidase)/N-methyltransferase